jgi:diguanylate cyclase (GGDEF)-like protein
LESEPPLKRHAAARGDSPRIPAAGLPQGESVPASSGNPDATRAEFALKPKARGTMQDRLLTPPPAEANAPSREELIVEYIFTLLALPSLPEGGALPEEIRDIKKMQAVHSMLMELRSLSFALSKGELEYISRERGFIIGALKALQSNLRHLTWQTQRIAEGEYEHRVSFLGDFATAFNKMTERLAGKFTELRKVSEEYKEISSRDALTGVYNRYGFFNNVEKSMSGLGKDDKSTLIIADIDHFKKINDTYGHPCGDEVLRAFAGKILSLLRQDDLYCRYGGEEFLILMPGTPLSVGLTIAERLRKAIADTVISHLSNEIRITSSFGMCEMEKREPGEDFDEYLQACIQAADKNLYKAKEGGRNRVVA